MKISTCKVVDSGLVFLFFFQEMDNYVDLEKICIAHATFPL